MEKIGHAILFIVEIVLKIAAGLAAVISLAAAGGFIHKIVEGFQSLPAAIRKIYWWFENAPEINTIVEDYNTMTAASFNQKYGMEAVNSVMDYLNETVAWLQQVYLNLTEEPVGTVLAVIIVFAAFYLTARLLRFYRQKGQGSFVTKFERRAGNRIFFNRRGDTA